MKRKTTIPTVVYFVILMNKVNKMPLEKCVKLFLDS